VKEELSFMDQAVKKQVLRSFTYGLYLITVKDGEEANCFTANWVSQASFEPPMVVFSMENDSRSIGMIRRSGAFVVHVIPEGYRDFAGRMGRSSKQNPNKISEVEWEPGEVTGSPILKELAGWVECRLVGTLPAGDHTLMLGEVVNAGIGRDLRPLTLSEAGFKYSG